VSPGSFYYVKGLTEVQDGLYLKAALNLERKIEFIVD
jgi:hypothetical protein